MTKKWIAVNLLLLAIAALLGWQLRKSILQFDAENNLAKIQPVKDMKQKIVQEKPPARTIPVNQYNPAEYSIIQDKNLFVEARSKEEKAEAPPPETPPLTQKPILVGVTITETQATASIIDPGSPQERGERTRRAQIKRIGDVYRGYTITQIAPDSIILESGTRREIIPLHEGTKRPPAGKTPLLSTRVVSFGGGGGSGGTRVSTAGGGPSAQPARTAIAPVGSSTSAATAQPKPVRVAPAANETPAAAAAAAAAEAPDEPAPKTTPRPVSPNRTIDSQGRQVIRTPFGDIVRPAR